MDRNQAIAHADRLASSSTDFADYYHERAVELLNDPDDLMQGAFGVCAMTSMVWSLLHQADLTKFVALLDAVFADAPFNGIQAPPGKLLEGRQKQFDRKKDHRSVVGGNLPDSDYELDFILARSLGKLLKIKSPLIYSAALDESSWMVANFKAREGTSVAVICELSPAYAAELNAGTISDRLAHELRMNDLVAQMYWGFAIHTAGATVTTVTPGSHWTLLLAGNTIPDRKTRTLTIKATSGGALQVTYDPFGEPGSYQRDGDLGVGPTGMSWLMLDVLGAKSCRFEHSFLDGLDAIKTVNAEFDQPHPFVYAFVDSSVNWQAAKRGEATPFDVAPTPHARYIAKPPVTGTHIVVVTGKITESPTHVRVPCWTWGVRFTADIPKGYLTAYIRGYAHGQL
ncbi:hypothetical protein [Dactylosporangium sp. CA-139066]|uniref:hypothetical protein n=1 Tax=Dactylosporangium sp. CA-139066 TaxID=3239930 RepID=UPI003D93D7E9